MLGRELILNNFGWKMTALLLATVVWFTFRSDGEKRTPAAGSRSSLVTREFHSLPIRILHAAADSGKYHVQPGALDITVNGPKPVLDLLSAEDIQVFVNLSRALIDHRSTNTVQVFTPAGVSLVNVNPAKVRIERAAP